MKSAVIYGKLVYLRPLERSDLTAEYLDWLNDPETGSRIASSSFPINMHRLEEYFEASQSNSTVMFAICDHETDTHVGNARISQIDWIHRVALYGRLIGRREFRGRGYGTDALIQLLRFGFHKLGLNRLWTGVIADNVASLASNDKVGMTREGILREFQFLDGRFRDAVAVAMLRSDFDSIHGNPDIWERREKEWREKPSRGQT